MTEKGSSYVVSARRDGPLAGSGAASGLRASSVGLPHILFQAISHMGPAAGVALSLLVGFTFAGPAMPLAVLIALVIALLIANSVGQLAKKIPSAGSMYTYTAKVLGPRAGFFVGWSTCLLELVVAPAISILLGIMISDALRTSAHVHISWAVFTVISLLFVAASNYQGVRTATGVGIVLGSLEMLVFGALAITMIVHAGSANTLQVFNPAHALTTNHLSGVFKGVVFSILAFQGFETAAPLAEEAKNPRKDIFRGVFYSALIVGGFYLVCSYASVVGWGFGSMSSYGGSPDPWIDLGHKFWGVGWVLVLLALVNSAVANANGGTVASTRMMFAMGRIGVLPSAVGRTHPKNETPHIAVIVTAGVSIAASLIFGFWIGPFNTFIVMATILTVLVILVYMLVCASVIVYYLRDARDEFRLFKHGVFPGLAVLILILPLYFQFHPLPPYPVSIGNWLGLAWAVIGIVLAFVLSARRPEAMAAAQEVFVAEDEAIVEAGKA